MTTYIVKGYTTSNPDFTATISFDGNLHNAFDVCDRRYSNDWNRLKALLVETSCPGDYLDVFDECSFELREDLEDTEEQFVAVAEAAGCEHCFDEGHNESTEHCSDEPHGSFMLTFDRIEEVK